MDVETGVNTLSLLHLRASEHSSVYEPNLVYHDGKWKMSYVAGSNREDLDCRASECLQVSPGISVDAKSPMHSLIDP